MKKWHDNDIFQNHFNRAAYIPLKKCVSSNYVKASRKKDQNKAEMKQKNDEN